MRDRSALTRSETQPPLHIRIRETIRRRVRKGELVGESGPLLTEAELVKLFGVSRVTIRHAISPLVEEGMFARERGRGTFLRSNEPENWVGRLLGFSETIRDAGFEPGARILHKGMTNRHDPTVRDLLKERAVWELNRLRLADDTPIAVEHAYYPPDIGLEIEKRDLTSIVMYRVFEDDLGIDIKEASQTISAGRADAISAKLLSVEEGSPVLSMQRLTVSADGRPLELLRSVYLSEFFQFAIKLTRRRAQPQDGFAS